MLNLPNIKKNEYMLLTLLFHSQILIHGIRDKYIIYKD